MNDQSERTDAPRADVNAGLDGSEPRVVPGQAPPAVDPAKPTPVQNQPGQDRSAQPQPQQGGDVKIDTGGAPAEVKQG